MKESLNEFHTSHRKKFVDNLKDSKIIPFNRRSIFLILFLFFIPSMILFSYGETEGSIEIELRDLKGERVSTSKITLEIFQNNSEKPILIVDEVKNPHTINSLQMDQTYKIIVYRNGVYSSYGIITLDENSDEIEIRLSNKAKISTTVFYSDGITPLQGATLIIKSQDGTEWKKKLTDSDGKIGNQSLQSVISDSDYYFMEISLSEDILFKTKPFRFYAGSQDIEIITPWPELIDKLIVIKVAANQDLSSNPFNDLLLSLEDSKGNIHDSEVDWRGIARFSLIPPDSYSINLYNTTISGKKEYLVSSKQIILDGNQELFFISIGQNEINPSEGNSVWETKWIKFLVRNWYYDEISDFEFMSGFLLTIKNEKFDETQPSSSKLVIPKWFKNNALWYYDGKISTNTFINAMDFLLKKEIISIG